MSPREGHLIHRSGWLRATVLGANDGIVSTASLIVGVAAAQAGRGQILVAGIAGVVAGSLSMAAGEYVSVRSQSDTEEADLAKEQAALQGNAEYETAELAAIYVDRGLTAPLAGEVARQLMAHDALSAHARDELGLSPTLRARPVEAALSSAGAFAAGAILPLGTVYLVPHAWLIPAVAAAVLIALSLLGTLSALAGGAPVIRSVLRIVLWGGVAMGLTALVGRLVGAVV